MSETEGAQFQTDLESAETLYHWAGARCSSMVEHPIMVRWVFRSIPHGGLIDLFLVPASAPQLV